MNQTASKQQELQEELHYKAAYLRLFGAVAGLAERIETNGIHMSLAEIRRALEHAMQDAEDQACGG